MKKIVLYAFLVITLMSCEKEIQIDLNSSNPRYVIEANVSTELNLSKVRITKSLNFNQPLPYPTINNAMVSIKDNTTNQVYAFINSEDGLYTNNIIQGVERHSYTLTVQINDERFTATSTIPKTVVLDTLKQIDLAEVPKFGSDTKSYAKIIPEYTDPTEKFNRYQFIVEKNGKTLGNIFIDADFIFNGTVNTRDLLIEAKKGDSITVDMHCIDMPIFEYYYGLSQSIPGFGEAPGASPTNPTSNINNNVLGYFKAHTTSKKFILVK